MSKEYIVPLSEDEAFYGYKEKCYGDYLAGNFYRNGYKNWRVKK